MALLGGHLIRPYLLLPPLALLGACGADHLTEGEARSTFEAVNGVTDDLVLLARDAVEQGATASFAVADADGGLSIHGEATEGNDWSGRATLDGLVTDDGDQVGYELAVTLDQVEIVDGPTIDGALDVAFTVSDFGTADLKWTLAVSVDGALDLTGAVAGHADLHYDLTLTIDGWSVSFAATGTINGFDVSPWNYAESFLSF